MTALADQREVSRVGQLVHLRAVSRKLAFGDLVLDGQVSSTVRLVFKAWIDRRARGGVFAQSRSNELTTRGPTLPTRSGLTVEDLHYVRCIIKLGDTLRVTGRPEDGTCRVQKFELCFAPCSRRTGTHSAACCATQVRRAPPFS